MGHRADTVSVSAILVVQQGLRGAEFRTLGPMASIELKQKDSWCISKEHAPHWSGCRTPCFQH